MSLVLSLTFCVLGLGLGLEHKVLDNITGSKQSCVMRIIISTLTNQCFSDEEINTTDENATS